MNRGRHLEVSEEVRGARPLDHEEEELVVDLAEHLQHVVGGDGRVDAHADGHGLELLQNAEQLRLQNVTQLGAHPVVRQFVGLEVT